MKTQTERRVINNAAPRRERVAKRKEPVAMMTYSITIEYFRSPLDMSTLPLVTAGGRVIAGTSEKPAREEKR